MTPDDPRPWYIVGLRVDQVGPDSWEQGSVVLPVTAATTIGEIREWAKRRRLLASAGDVTFLSLSMDEVLDDR